MSNDIYARLRELAASAEARPAVMRPVLLRVITDLFALHPAHTPQEIRLYEEMAGELIADADEPTLALVARRLATTPDAPESVLRRIRERGGAAAQEILRIDPHVEWRELRRIATNGGSGPACAIAGRADLDRDLTRLLSQRPEIEVARALVANASAPLGVEDLRHLIARGRDDSALARALLDRGVLTLEHLPLFLSAHAAERAQLILLARRASLALTGRADAGAPLDAEAQRRLEADAPHRKRSGFALTLAEILGCDAALAKKMVEDESGEAMTLAFIAIGLPKESCARIFIAAFPKIALARENFERLLELFDTLPRRDARRIAAAFGAIPDAGAARTLARRAPGAAMQDKAPPRENALPARRDEIGG